MAGTHDKGAGAYSKSYPKITDSKMTNAAGNPTGKSREVPPSNKNDGFAASMSAGAVTRPIYKSAVRRHFGR